MLGLIIFKLFLIALICAFTSSTNSTIINVPKDINTNFVKLYEKFDYLNDKVSQLENQTNKITELLTELVAHHKKGTSGSTCDLEHALSAEYSSMCHARANRWANETRLNLRHGLEAMDPFISDHSNVTRDQKPYSVCEPNPCQHGGRCELESTGREYKCNCPYPCTGKNCEVISCNQNKCFIRNEVYYEYNEIKANWDEANRKCLEKGMTLAIMKDKETYDFLQTKTRSLYSAGSDYFWVGLKATGGKWQWVDGSPLGEYRGVIYNELFKTNTNGFCCLMHLQTGRDYCSPGEPCTNAWYSICEKRLSAV